MPTASYFLLFFCEPINTAAGAAVSLAAAADALHITTITSGIAHAAAVSAYAASHSIALNAFSASAALHSTAIDAAVATATSISAATATVSPNTITSVMRSYDSRQAAVGRIVQVEFRRLGAAVFGGGKPAQVVKRVQDTAASRAPIISWSLDNWLKGALRELTRGT